MTVCVAESSLVTVIFAPGATVFGVWNLKSLIVIDAVAAAVELSDPDPAVDFVDDDDVADVEGDGADAESSSLLPDVPQAASTNSAAATTPAEPTFEVFISSPP